MRTLIIAAYIGPLPEMMGLWLRSAGCNPEFDFLVLSDRDPQRALPENVQFLRMDLLEMRSRFDAIVGFDTALTSPYKLNDFKPLFWCLAPDINHYDYWGYCDLDVIFGRLDALSDNCLGHYDMILSEGHLRFLRNDERTRNAWRHVAHPRSWRDILTDEANFGMDEHHGINRVFGDFGRSWFSDPSLIADIDPGFRQFRRLPELANWRHQAFFWQDGRIYHEWIEHGTHCQREMLYIHLQKRKLVIDPTCNSAPAFNIDPDRITPRSSWDDGADRIVQRNPWRFPNFDEARILLRELRRRLLGKPGSFGRVDRPVTEHRPG